MHMVRVFPIPGVDDLVNTSGISTTDRGIHSGNIVCEYIYIYVYTHDIMIWFIDVFFLWSKSKHPKLGSSPMSCRIVCYAKATSSIRHLKSWMASLDGLLYQSHKFLGPEGGLWWFLPAADCLDNSFFGVIIPADCPIFEHWNHQWVTLWLFNIAMV